MKRYVVVGMFVPSCRLYGLWQCTGSFGSLFEVVALLSSWLTGWIGQQGTGGRSPDDALQRAIVVVFVWDWLIYCRRISTGTYTAAPFNRITAAAAETGVFEHFLTNYCFLTFCHLQIIPLALPVVVVVIRSEQPVVPQVPSIL